jgi:DNA-binding transcriptional regulator GbsR (MarR family)
MNENFLIAQNICIDHAVQLSGLLGLSDGMARIVALLYMSPEPVSIPTVCDKLSLTKGTVSLYLRLLEQRKAVTRAWSKRQGKQKFYEMNPRLWTDLLEDLGMKARRRFEITEDAIQRSLETIRKDESDYDGEDRLISKLLTERLERIRQMNNISRTMFERFLMDKSGVNDGASSLTKIELAEE